MLKTLYGLKLAVYIHKFKRRMGRVRSNFENMYIYTFYFTRVFIGVPACWCRAGRKGEGGIDINTMRNLHAKTSS